jgi:DNA-directed RNA polymerase subunit RPC12/RpoP
MITMQDVKAMFTLVKCSRCGIQLGEVSKKLDFLKSSILCQNCKNGSAALPISLPAVVECK